VTMTSEPASTAALAAGAALPLTPTQRIMLRELLHQSWRGHVVDITNLAVRFHTREEPAVAARLAAARRALVDVESALERLDSGSYGHCDACERRIPFELLEATPDCRYCRRCQPR
jgi:RNA polymerase-binding transcription factor DksA